MVAGPWLQLSDEKTVISVYKSFGKVHVTQFLLDVYICVRRLAYNINHELVISETPNPEILNADVSTFFVFDRAK
jgi:hypothetical protein